MESQQWPPTIPGTLEVWWNRCLITTNSVLSAEAAAPFSPCGCQRCFQKVFEMHHFHKNRMLAGVAAWVTVLCCGRTQTAGLCTPAREFKQISPTERKPLNCFPSNLRAEPRQLAVASISIDRYERDNSLPKRRVISLLERQNGVLPRNLTVQLMVRNWFNSLCICTTT